MKKKAENIQVNYEVRAHALRLMRGGNYTAKQIVKNTIASFPEVSIAEIKKEIGKLCESLNN